MKHHEKWLKQADYDIETAANMFGYERNHHAAFFCRLATERALKGLFAFRFGQPPPKTTNLAVLAKQVGMTPPENDGEPVSLIRQLQMVTLYPDDLSKALKKYTSHHVESLLSRCGELLESIKEQARAA